MVKHRHPDHLGRKIRPYDLIRSPTRNLYLLALSALRAVNETDPLSYSSIAGESCLTGGGEGGATSPRCIVSLLSAAGL